MCRLKMTSQCSEVASYYLVPKDYQFQWVYSRNIIEVEALPSCFITCNIIDIIQDTPP